MHNWYVRLSVYVWLVVFVLVCSSHTYCQTAAADKPPVIDAQLRQRLVENIIRELHAKYIVPEKTKELESYLRTKLTSGAQKQVKQLNSFWFRLRARLVPI